MSHLIEIKNLSATIEGKKILDSFSLAIAPGEIHAIMGPNGAGKSTLAKVLAGHPSYEVTEGEVWFEGQNLLDLEPEERSHLGLFVSFQYPVEVPGVGNIPFLQAALKERGSFDEKRLDEKMAQLHIKPEFKERNVNEGFSGGEKKRNEILQMALLEPKLAVLDETDSGLDIDALRIVADGVNTLMHPKMGLLLITHYQRLLDYITPHHVHVMIDGKVVQSGGPELAHTLEAQGYGS